MFHQLLREFLQIHEMEGQTMDRRQTGSIIKTIFKTLNAPITTKVFCFSHLLKCLYKICLRMANSVNPDQTAPIGAVCSGSTLFASILNSSIMLGNYLQQTTSADDIFSWHFKG